MIYSTFMFAKKRERCCSLLIGEICDILLPAVFSLRHFLILIKREDWLLDFHID